jgi:hypothetical protein
MYGEGNIYSLFDGVYRKIYPERLRDVIKDVEYLAKESSFMIFWCASLLSLYCFLRFIEAVLKPIDEY